MARDAPDPSDPGIRTSVDGALRSGRAYRDRALAGLRSDERAWLRGAQAGSLPDLEALFREHWPRAYRAAYLIVHDGAAAEDISQEAFLAAIRALHRFDGRRQIGPWLHRLVVNRAIDWAGSRALRAEVGEGQLAAVSEDDNAGRLSAPPVIAALATLTPEQRAVIVLRHLLEYSTGEIAAMLEVPRRTVSTTLQRGVDELGDLLEGER
jgi:RNA polymerase sigma-70 factor, ECF subfamily